MHAPNTTLSVCHPEAGPGEHYVDSIALQALFLNPSFHFQQISEAIFLIAQRIGQGIEFRATEDRDDAVANATLHAMRRVDRRPAPDNAFAYFSLLIRHRLINERRNQQRHARRYQTGQDLDGL